jgi:hypothetical protein
MLNETHRAPPRYKIFDFFSSLLEGQKQQATQPLVSSQQAATMATTKITAKTTFPLRFFCSDTNENLSGDGNGLLRESFDQLRRGLSVANPSSQKEVSQTWGNARKEVAGKSGG